MFLDLINAPLWKKLLNNILNDGKPGQKRQQIIELTNRSQTRKRKNLAPARIGKPYFMQGKRKTRKMGALRVVYDNEIYENFIEVVQKKTINDKALILKSLKTHFTFSSLIEDK